MDIENELLLALKKPVAQDDEVVERLNQRKEAAKKESLMALLTSGAASLLSGPTAGANIAQYGNQLSDQRLAIADKMDDSMSAYGMAQAKAKLKSNLPKGRRYQAISVEDDQGNIVIKPFDTYTGQVTEGSLGVKGLSPWVGKNPVDEQIGRMSKGRIGQKIQRVETEGIDGGRFNVKQEKDVRSAKKEFASDPLYRSTKNALVSSARAVNLLQSGLDVADEGIKVIFPRMFGEVGNLAYQEQERFAGSPALQQKFRTLLAKYRDEREAGRDPIGAFDPQDRSDLIELAQVMNDYDRQVMSRLAQSAVESEKVITGQDISDVIEPLTKTPGIPRKQTRKGKPPIQGKTMRRVYNGKPALFRKTSKGWELVRYE